MFVIGTIWLFKVIVEPIYVLIYKKPLIVHLYFFPEKLSENYQTFLGNHFTFYKRLSPEYQKYFDHRILTFIKKTEFNSRENVNITFEMKLLLVAPSVILTFGMPKYRYTVVKNIIVYPTSFLSVANTNYHIGEFNPKLKTLVFSWHDFYEGIKIDNDNLNLGIHEFSHALLFESLQKTKYSSNNNSVFADYYNEIIADLKKPEIRQAIIDTRYFRDYAFTNAVEFIAVILEHFFETPEQFKLLLPELFLKVKKMINYNENIFIS